MYDISMLSLTFYKTENNTDYECFIHDLQLSLFDLYHITIIYRENGKTKSKKNYTFQSHSEKDEKIHDIFMEKIKEGYRIEYTLPRNIDELNKMNVI